MFTVLLVIGAAGVVVSIFLSDWLALATSVVLCITAIVSLVKDRQRRDKVSD